MIYRASQRVTAGTGGELIRGHLSSFQNRILLMGGRRSGVASDCLLYQTVNDVRILFTVLLLCSKQHDSCQPSIVQVKMAMSH